MTLNVNLLLCRQCYAHCDQTAMLDLRGFHYKVPLHLSYSYIKFDDESSSRCFNLCTAQRTPPNCIELS